MPFASGSPTPRRSICASPDGDRSESEACAGDKEPRPVGTKMVAEAGVPDDDDEDEDDDDDDEDEEEEPAAMGVHAGLCDGDMILPRGGCRAA